MTGLRTADTRAWQGWWGRQVAAEPWEGQEAQDPPSGAPHTPEMPEARAWEQAGARKRHESLQRELVSPKVPDR